MIPLAEIIAEELAAPAGKDLQERFLQAMFMMERFRGVDAGWRDAVAEVRDADVSDAAIHLLATSLRTFVVAHRSHPDVGSAIWALGALRAADDALVFKAVLGAPNDYGRHAREQAECALENLHYGGHI